MTESGAFLYISVMSFIFMMKSVCFLCMIYVVVCVRNALTAYACMHYFFIVVYNDVADRCFRFF